MISDSPNIILDYGGVLTRGSRKVSVASHLAGSDGALRLIIDDFFSSDFVVEAALGRHDSEEVVSRLASVSGVAVATVRSVLTEACWADDQAINLVRELSRDHALYLVSDSLPPFSDYIEETFHGLFVSLFLSDRFGARKSDNLFHIAHDQIPDLFRCGVYIDDLPKNLVLPAVLGAKTIAFQSVEQLRILLGK